MPDPNAERRMDAEIQQSLGKFMFWLYVLGGNASLIAVAAIFTSDYRYGWVRLLLLATISITLTYEWVKRSPTRSIALLQTDHWLRHTVIACTFAFISLSIPAVLDHAWWSFAWIVPTLAGATYLRWRFHLLLLRRIAERDGQKPSANI